MTTGGQRRLKSALSMAGACPPPAPWVGSGLRGTGSTTGTIGSIGAGTATDCGFGAGNGCGHGAWSGCGRGAECSYGHGAGRGCGRHGAVNGPERRTSSGTADWGFGSGTVTPSGTVSETGAEMVNGPEALTGVGT